MGNTYRLKGDRMKKSRYSTETTLEAIAGRLHLLNKTDPKLAQMTLDRIMGYLLPPKGDDVRKTYQIELKIDFEDKDRHKIAAHLMRKAARTILTQANMIADGREPQISFRTDDFFEGGTIESLQELSGLEEVGDGILPDNAE